MTVKQVLAKLNEFKVVITLVLGVIAIWLFISGPKTMAEGNQKHLEKVDKLLAGQLDMLNNMYRDIARNEGKLEGWLEGMKIDPEGYRKWIKMPKEPVLDSLGEPKLNTSYVEITDGLLLWVEKRVILDNNGNPQMVVDTVLDVREK